MNTWQTGVDKMQSANDTVDGVYIYAKEKEKRKEVSKRQTECKQIFLQIQKNTRS
jgi:hypothetical protein